VAMTVLNHVPYEFYQPYLDFLLDQVAWTPLVTGVTMASMLLLAALASAQAERVASWAGTGPTLLGAMALQIGVILAMAVTVHPAVVLAILLRSVPMGLMRPVLGAAIHPRLRSDLRATWLSVQSLVGRLSFAVALTAASIGVGETALSEASMTMVLRGFAVVGLVIFCGFALTVRATRSPAAER